MFPSGSFVAVAMCLYYYNILLSAYTILTNDSQVNWRTMLNRVQLKKTAMHRSASASFHQCNKLQQWWWWCLQSIILKQEYSLVLYWYSRAALWVAACNTVQQYHHACRLQPTLQELPCFPFHLWCIFNHETNWVSVFQLILNGLIRYRLKFVYHHTKLF